MTISCESIRSRVRRYLEDLLEENEYQEVRAHLAECADCRGYAASIGTLTYQLEELGEVRLPQDLIPTILYQLQQPSGDGTKGSAPMADVGAGLVPARAWATTRAAPAVWVGIIVLGLVGFVYGKFHQPARSIGSDDGVARRAVPLPPPAETAVDAERERPGKLFEKVKTELYGSDQDEDALVGKLKALAEDAESDPGVLVMKELKAILRSEKGARASGVLTKIEEITSLSGLKAVLYDADEKKLAGLRKLLREAESGPKSLEEWRPVHWHYHLSSSSQSEFLQIARTLGLSMDYESSKFFLLYVPKNKLQDFARQISALSGMVTNFNEMDPDRVSEKSVQVSVYFLEP